MICATPWFDHDNLLGIKFKSVQFRPLTTWIAWETRGAIQLEILFQSCFAEGLREQLWRLFDVVHSSFSLPTTASPTLRDALKDDFGEAVAAYDMSKPCIAVYWALKFVQFSSGP